MSLMPFLFIFDPNWYFCTQIEENSANEYDFSILAMSLED